MFKSPHHPAVSPTFLSLYVCFLGISSEPLRVVCIWEDQKCWRAWDTSVVTKPRALCQWVSGGERCRRCFTTFLERMRKDLLSQTNIGTVSKGTVTVRGVLRDRIECIWGFHTLILSWTELNWHHHHHHQEFCLPLSVQIHQRIFIHFTKGGREGAISPHVKHFISHSILGAHYLLRNCFQFGLESFTKCNDLQQVLTEIVTTVCTSELF